MKTIGPTLLSLAIIFFALTTLEVQAKGKCHVVRGGFDIGSGATKMIVAKIDTCKNKILKILKEQQMPVGYKDHLAKDKNDELSSFIQDQGIMALRKLKSVGRKYNVTQWSAVATSAFRKAVNAKTYTQRIKKELNINVHILDQRTEALIGLLAVKSKVNEQVDSYVVWDIGGGSMQMVYDSDDNYHIYEGKLASVTFKNFIIESLQLKDINLHRSPNPMGDKIVRSAMKMSEYYAKLHVPLALKRSIATKKVYGIGGVHYYSIRDQLGIKDSYTIDKLMKVIKDRMNLTDKEIGGQYYATEISNMALVAGFMKGLNIKEVRPLNINLNHGLLIYKAFWP
jgi:exopolyphosphatase/guanosine-5'-triphosphate,3'-diphosphate pyrophosphatase